MYARGILFGKMKYELGDHSFVRCPESGLVADIEFKTKGYFSGKYDAIGGFIKEIKTDKNLFELSGAWNGEMFIKDLAVSQPRLKQYLQPTDDLRDWQKGVIVRCQSRWADIPNGKTNRRTGATRIPEAVG